MPEHHKHDFPIITEWCGTEAPFYQVIVGHKDCECGTSYNAWFRELFDPGDPIAQARYAADYIKRHYASS